MKKKYLLFFLHALAINSITAQTTITQSGLTTIAYNLPEGSIRIFLPDDIRPGDMISGKISVSPSGKNKSALEKNMAGLKKYSLRVDDRLFAIDNAETPIQLSFNTGQQPAGRLQLVYDVKTLSGEVVDIKVTPNPKANPITECSIPSHALCASPLRINGPFDGDAADTRCFLGNQLLQVLAESPRQCILEFPADALGTQALSVREKNMQVCSQNVSAVIMDVSAGKLNLRKGEKTFVEVKISGLKNLQDTAILTVENQTTSVVTMQPSDNVLISLVPDSVGAGIFERTFYLQSKIAGSFTVTVNLDLPESGSYLASVNSGVEKPPVYADNNGGIELHPLKVDGLKNGMSDVFKKTVIEITGNRATKYPELDGCGSCLTCIQSMLDEVKVALVGEVGKILMEHYVDLLVGKAGGALAWIKDKYDKLEKAQDIADALAAAVAKNELQVVEFEEKLCGYCLVSAIGFYDTKTGCMDAFFYCKGSKMCCTHSLTIIHVKYCVGADGFIKPNTGIDIDVISR